MKSALLIPILCLFSFPMLYLLEWLLCPLRLYRVVYSIHVRGRWHEVDMPVPALCSLLAGWSALRGARRRQRAAGVDYLIRLDSVTRHPLRK